MHADHVGSEVDIDLFHMFLEHSNVVWTDGQEEPLKEEEWIRQLKQMLFEFIHCWSLGPVATFTLNLPVIAICIGCACRTG